MGPRRPYGEGERTFLLKKIMKSPVILLVASVLLITFSSTPTRGAMSASKFADQEPINALVRSLKGSSGHAVSMEGSESSLVGLELSQEWQGNVLRSRLKNHGASPVRVKEVVLFEGEHGLAGSTPFYGEGFQMLAQSGGTLAQPEDWGSYPDRTHYKIPEPAGYRSVYGLLALSPSNASPVVLGFASCRRFIGRFDLAAERLRVVEDTEGRELGPGQTWRLEDLMVSSGSPREVLYEELARAIEKNHPHLRFGVVPTGWCSWYYFYEHVSAGDVYTNLNFIAANLPQLKYIQIDDGYQPWMGDWLEPGTSFGGNVREVIGQIRSRGFEPAIWLAPFVASPESKLFRDHPDWFIQDQGGKPLRSDKVSFGGWRQGPWYCLDSTHPEVQKFLEATFRTLREEWGCTYFKLDAAFWGAMHGGRFRDPSATRVEAYRRGLEAIRRGAGSAFILACNHPIWPSLGLVHGARTSMDIDRSWATFSAIGRQSLRRNWQNGRLWWNDPDCVLLTGELPENEFLFHVTLIYATGGMLLAGDDLTRLSPSHLALLRKLLPPTGIAAEFESDKFEVGRVQLPGREMVALFNWDDHPVTRNVRLRGKSSIRDYWTDADLGQHDGEFPVREMAPHSARLLVVSPTPAK